jgi:L-asparaginase/Glu-tRNA(Gln) amidotransferase subunit D
MDKLFQTSSVSDIPNTPVYLNSVVDYQRASANVRDTVQVDIARVLMIYTGGTIGMAACGNQASFCVLCFGLSNCFHSFLARLELC